MTKYFSSLVDQSLSRSTEATLSILSITDPDLRAHLAQQMRSDCGKEGSFLSSPMFEHTFGWAQSDYTMLQLAEKESLLSNEIVKSLDNKNNGRYRFGSDWKPFTHQLDSWRSLLDKKHSVVVTSGTGSGKTECFMVPVLEDLYREYHKNDKKPLIGVRAIFLYPLNALINSQRERLNEWTKSFDKGIRYSLYNGNTEELHAKVRTEQNKSPNEILSRELLREEPAPILVTNGTMLEYMIIRQVDAPIIQKSREQKSLRWIVLDEAHTYVGSQAAELALQLRRVMNAFGVTPIDVRFVATSATIAGDGASEQLKQFLHDLSGIPVSQIDVFSGSRVIPELPKCEGRPISLDELEHMQLGSDTDIHPVRYDALTHSPAARTLRSILVDSNRPLSLTELSQSLSQVGSEKFSTQSVLRLLDICTETKPSKNEQAFIRLRAHFFQRTTHGLWVCVNRNCTEKQNTQLVETWPFGYVYVNHRQTCKCGSPVYELAFCNDCNEPHLLARDKKGQLVQWQVDDSDEFTLQEEIVDDTDDHNTESDSSRHPLVLADNHNIGTNYIQQVIEPQSRKIVSQSDDGLLVALNDIQAICSASNCSYTGLNGSSPFRRALLGGPFYIANVVPTVLEYCPDYEKSDNKSLGPQSLPGRGRRLITFTDSRQGTARISIRMQQEAERNRLRGMVFEKLAHQRRWHKNDDIDNSLIQSLRMSGLSEDMITDVLKAKQLLELHKEAVLSWPELIDELKSLADLQGPMLLTNKYHRPDIFGDLAGPVKLAEMLLFREFMRRPKRQNSLETLGLVKVGYKGLDNVSSVPLNWEKSELSLQDWKDFLKVSLDFYVRENNFTQLESELKDWIGSRFSSKTLINPQSKEQDEARVKRWPQIRKGNYNQRLIKLLFLGAKLTPSRTDHIDLVNEWLQQAWLQLSSSMQTAILKADGNQFYLPRQNLTFSLISKAYICPITNKLIDTTFKGLTPYLPTRIELDKITEPEKNKFVCQEIAMPEVWQFDRSQQDFSEGLATVRDKIEQDLIVADLRSRNLWTDINDRTIEGGFYYRTAEHSAQQSSKRLENYEEMFKSGKLNVLNCSTTMEMGVDIGGISAVVMNNVPPHPANYLQRAGRAGRSNESRALSYTLCKNNPHDLQVFTNPDWPWSTKIAAPAVTLNSERLVQRHVNSLLLSEFLCSKLKTVETDRTKLNTFWFFYEDNEQSICGRFKDWLKSTVLDIDNGLSILVKDTVLQGRNVSTLRLKTVALIEQLQTRWLSEYQYLISEEKEAKPNSPYRKRIEKEKDRLCHEYLLRDLASRTFLPGYGFPTDVVNFDNFTMQDYLQEKGQSAKAKYDREDNVSRYKGLPSRNLSTAIREYAPGAEISLDGRVFKSAGVSLHWHNLNSNANEAQKMDIAWRCHNCGELGYEDSISKHEQIICSNEDCQSSIKQQNIRRVLQPSGFVTDAYASTSNNIENQKFIPIEPSWIFIKAERVQLPNPSLGYMSSGVDGHVFHQSLGEFRHGYALCMTCGRAESMLSKDEVPKSMGSHFPPRPSREDKDDNNKRIICQGSSNYLTNITLGAKSNTDVFEIVLKHPVSGEYLGDNSENGKSIATTLAVAMRQSLAGIVGISSSEIGYSTRPVRLESGESVLAIQLYDVITGGAGFASSAPQYIEKLLHDTLLRLNCKHCSSACSECLLDSQSRHDHELLDNSTARAWLGKDFSHYVGLADEDKLSLSDAVYSPGSIESALRRFIKEGDEKVTLWLKGDWNDWDLTAPQFRKSIYDYVLNVGIQVSLVIPEDISDTELQQDLYRLHLLGVDICYSKLEPESSILVQIDSVSSTITLATKLSSASIPGPRWHQSEELVVVSKKQAMIGLTPVDVSKWSQSDSDSHILDDIEIHQELNGKATKFGEHFWEHIFNRKPELAKKINATKIISIQYSDRYIQNPVAITFLGSILGYLREHMADDSSVEIKTLFNAQKNKGMRAFDDWNVQDDYKIFTETWLTKKVGKDASLLVHSSNKNVAHSRKLLIQFDNGMSLKIRFDQGMGYWKLHFTPRANLSFDFEDSVDYQLVHMAQALEGASVYNSEDKWATDVLIEFDPG
ncbi:MAG: DEAD/DEAH box helicase [Gammaproteobacteria bacterium]|nr:DEAD/DEAH box helicase [Gammaproteobacteria bacterium]